LKKQQLMNNTTTNQMVVPSYSNPQYAGAYFNTSQHQTYQFPTSPRGAASSLPSPTFPNPLVSMSNLAAMYQQQQQQQAQSPRKEPSIVTPPTNQRPLEHYKTASQEGKVPLDLLPEDVNAIMAQSTTPFCPICAKDCGNFPNLRSHLQVHNSIRPYACTYCEAKFARVSHLNRHIRTHTGERPFGCDRCGKNFARQDKLKLHMDRHVSRETKTDLMNHLMSSNTTQPIKKMKVEDQMMKQEMSGTNSPVVTNHQQQAAIANFSNMMTGGAGGGGLWGSFPGMGFQSTQYQAVYPGMVPTQYLGGHTAELQQVMKIGECSVKPLGQ